MQRLGLSDEDDQRSVLSRFWSCHSLSLISLVQDPRLESAQIARATPSMVSVQLVGFASAGRVGALWIIGRTRPVDMKRP